MIQLQFPGVSGKQFYQLIKQKTIQWEKLTKFNLILSRFDLVLSVSTNRMIKWIVRNLLTLASNNFRIITHIKILLLKRIKKVCFLKSVIVEVTRHYRLYTKDNFLRFKFEIKRNFIKDFHNLLLEYRLEEFEKILSYTFFKYSFEIFQRSRQPSHIDWLMNRTRPYQYKNKLFPKTSVINSHYIRHFAFQQFQQKLDLITLFQLLVYVRTLNCQTKTLTSSLRQFNRK